MNSPCKDCPDREASCHGKCDKCDAYRAGIDNVLQNRIADNGRYMTAARAKHLKDNLKYVQACFSGRRK